MAMEQHVVRFLQQAAPGSPCVVWLASWWSISRTTGRLQLNLHSPLRDGGGFQVTGLEANFTGCLEGAATRDAGLSGGCDPPRLLHSDDNISAPPPLEHLQI